MHRPRRPWSLAFAGLVVAALALGGTVMASGGTWVPGAGRIEEPAYTLLSQSGEVELRRYAPTIEAQVTVQAPYESAWTDGFRVLASYIFGANLPGRSIAMTAPVALQPAARDGTPIAMTTPVALTPAGKDVWTIAFTMPAEWSLDTLPAPKDPRVRLVPRPARTWAVLRFGGRLSQSTADARTAELQSAVRAAGWSAAGPPVLAQYNPPWIPGWFRRNEVLLPVDVPGAAAPGG